MAIGNPKVAGYPPQPVYDRLIEFKDAHGFKSVSQAVTAVLEEYFQLEPADSTLEATNRTSGAFTGSSEADSTRIRELEKTVTDHTQQLTDHAEKLSALTQQLSALTGQLSPTRVKSLKPTQQSTKPHNPIYGRGEAASIYPGWEPAADVSYVFDRFQALNTDEARAAFADKWVGLCAQSLDTAWVVCYRLVSIIKEKGMYKIPHWMEGNKTYNSFKDYFEHRFKQPFEKWLKLELTHQFVVENCPELLEALLHIENNPNQAQNGSGDRVLPSTPLAAESAIILQSRDKSQIDKGGDPPDRRGRLDNSGDSAPNGSAEQSLGSTLVAAEITTEGAAESATMLQSGDKSPIDKGSDPPDDRRPIDNS